MDINQPNRISLPDGGWADLRPVGEVSERLRRPIKRLTTKLASYPEFMAAVDAAKGKDLTQADQLKIASAMGEAFDTLEELQDQLVIAAVRGWSYSAEVSVDNLLDLPGRAVDQLREASAGYQSALNPDFDPNPSSDTPTDPFSA